MKISSVAIPFSFSFRVAMIVFERIPCFQAKKPYCPSPSPYRRSLLLHTKIQTHPTPLNTFGPQDAKWIWNILQQWYSEVNWNVLWTGRLVFLEITVGKQLTGTYHPITSKNPLGEVLHFAGINDDVKNLKYRAVELDLDSETSSKYISPSSTIANGPFWQPGGHLGKACITGNSRILSISWWESTKIWNEFFCENVEIPLGFPDKILLK